MDVINEKGGKCTGRRAEGCFLGFGFLYCWRWVGGQVGNIQVGKWGKEQLMFKVWALVVGTYILLISTYLLSGQYSSPVCMYVCM